MKKRPARPASGGKKARLRSSPRASAGGEPYVLKLFVAGTTPRSAVAVANLRAVCDYFLAGRHELEVVDIFQEPARAAENRVIAVPTLLKLEPAPLRCVVGDLSDRAKIMRALNLAGESRSVA